MSRKVSIDPLTRIEGHLAVKVDVEDNRVTQAWSQGEMFRGFEVILQGRDPMDAQQITQRICGVCPISHGLASVHAQDDAYGITPPENGWLLRNLILGANYIQSHIIHFYHLCALDFIDITAILAYSGQDPMMTELKSWVQLELRENKTLPVAPFLPRYEGNYVTDLDINLGAIHHYLRALEIRQIAQEAAAIFCGKIPHSTTIVPGGVTEKVTADKLVAYLGRLQKLKNFIDECYIPDVLAVAGAYPEYWEIGKGCGQFLSYGVFSQDGRPNAQRSNFFLPAGTLQNGVYDTLQIQRISEEIRHSFFSSTSGLHPATGETVPAAAKHGAYSWLKAPRYGGKPMEVGPLARILVAYHQGSNRSLNTAVDSLLGTIGKSPAALDSLLGRHAARALECKMVADLCFEWADRIRPGQPSAVDFTIPAKGSGVGLTEAPRGALGHWIEIADHRIHRYQCVVPTTWNCSPRDDQGIAGPVEQALLGTPVKDPDHPIEAARVVRSFDPCLACAVH